MATLTSREFAHDTVGAKKAARLDLVFIMDHGRPSQVLLTIEDYQINRKVSLAEALAQPSVEDFEFNPLRVEL